MEHGNSVVECQTPPKEPKFEPSSSCLKTWVIVFARLYKLSTCIQWRTCYYGVYLYYLSQLTYKAVSPLQQGLLLSNVLSKHRLCVASVGT